MSKLQISVRINIRKGMLEELKQKVSNCILKVKERDSGTIQYEWFLSDDNRECEIREAYESSDAYLVHLQNVADNLETIFEKYADVQSVIIYGNPSREVLERAASRAGVPLKVYSFLQGVDTRISDP